MYKKISSLLIFSSSLFAHGVSKSTVDAMSDASLIDYLYFGAEHMVTGYDHILFLIGVVFFLTHYLDIFKFITSFTIAHCVTLIFATFYGISADAFLIDAIIAFSVIYKGFENLDGFKKWFSKSPPNLTIMVFIFGLIHGFGLSTKLQEIAAEHHISLSLSQILSFNVGVELGQVMVLLIIFPILSMARGEFFEKISKISNWGLVIAGVLLLVYQLNGFFKGNSWTHNELHQEELDLDKHHHNHKHSHSHDKDHSHE